MGEINGRTYQIGDWLVIPGKNELVRGTEVLRIETKAMLVLDHLARHAGQVVSREELMKQVWPDVFVSEDTLSRCISLLRKTFQDTATKSNIIQTIKGEGYRIIVPVIVNDPPEESLGAGKTKALTSRVTPLVIGILLLLIIMAISVTFNSNDQNQVQWDRIPIATSKYDEMFPAISPDGSRIAYTMYTDSVSGTDIYLCVANSSDRKIRITDFAGDETCAVWSSDGRYLAFYKMGGPDPGIYRISALGGLPEKIGNPHEMMPQQMAWSHDGQTIAYSDRISPGDSYSIYALDVATGEKRKLTAPTLQHWGDYGPSFSPDDRELSFIRAVSAGTHDLFKYDFASGKSERLTHHTRRTTGQHWCADDRSLVYGHDEGQMGQLWKIDDRAGQPVRLELSGIRPSADRSGRNLVVEDWHYDYDIFYVDLSNPDEKRLLPGINSSYEDFDAVESPDGDQIAFVSNRSGSYELWIYRKSDQRVSRCTNFGDAGFLSSPRWSPDGTMLAVTAYTPRGNADLFLVDLNNNSQKALLASGYNEIAAAWTPDNTGIYYGSNQSGIWQIWFRDLKTETSRQVTQSGGYAPLVHQETGDLYFSKFDQTGVWKYTPQGGEQRIVDGLHLLDWANFDVDPEGGIYYVRRTSAFSPTSLQYQSPAGKDSTVMDAGFSKRMRLHLTRDGRLLGAHTVDRNVDLVLYTRKDRVSR